MDTSTSSASDVQTQQSSDDQVVNPSQQISQVPSSPQQKPQPKASTMISVGAEAGGGMMVQENPDADDEDEDELVAPQETKNLGVMGQGEEESDEQHIISQPSVVDIQEQAVELQPAVPEFPASSVEVEKVIERSPDTEKPDIPQAIQNVLTHSGPGVIDVTQINIEKVKLPVNYPAAVAEVKQTPLHDSKHWLMGMTAYIWRKIRPGIEKRKTEEMKIEKPVLAVTPALKTEEVSEIQATNG